MINGQSTMIPYDSEVAGKLEIRMSMVLDFKRVLSTDFVDGAPQAVLVVSLVSASRRSMESRSEQTPCKNMTEKYQRVRVRAGECQADCSEQLS